MDPRPARRAARPLAGALVVLALALAWWWALPPTAVAATTEVEVQRARFAPEAVTVHVGDTVVWRWTVDGESVTADEGASFDSHEDCAPFRPLRCGREGDTFSHEFTTAGTVTYVSRQTGAEATIHVKEAPRPSPPPETEPSADPSPAPARASEPGPEPTSPSPSSSPTSEPPPPSTDDDPAPAPTTRTAAPNTLDSEPATVDDSETPRPDAPSVADGEPSPVPEPTFDDFPDATEPTPETQDVEGDVAISSPDEDGTSRVVWGAVGGLTVLGTLGAFGRRVLFADPWEA